MSSTAERRQGSGRADQTTRATLVVSCAATLLVLINFTAPIPAVAQIAGGLGGSGAAEQTWILGSTSLGLAAFLLISGALADRYGRKRVFVIGTLVLVLATVVCGLAPGTVIFVIGRVIQGAGSAAILTGSLGLLGHAYPPGAERARATGLWGAMIGGGVAIGPFVSALLAPAFGWRSVFAVLALLGALVAVSAIVAPTESRHPTTGHVDLGGAVLLAGGIGSLVAALTEGPLGWMHPSVLLFFALAAALLVAFVIVERHTPNPLLDLTLLTSPDFLASTVGAFFTGAAVIGFMTYVPNAAQNVLGLGVLASAGILAVWSGLSFLAAAQARRLIPLVGARHQVVVGLVVAAIGQLALLGIDQRSSWWQFVPGLAIAGIASGVVNAALAGMAVQSVPHSQVAMGSGANNTARYLGSSLGVAVVAGIITLGSHGSHAPDAYASGFSYAAAATAGMSFIGALLVAFCRTRVARTDRRDGAESRDRAGLSPRES